MPYSDDLRQKLLAAADTQSLPKTQLARLFGVSLSYLSNVLARRKRTGNTHVLPHGGGARPKLTASPIKALQAPVDAHPAVLLRELAAWLQQEYGVVLSLSRWSRLLRQLELPRTKGPGTPLSATRRPTKPAVPSGGRPEPTWTRHAWCLWMKAESRRTWPAATGAGPKANAYTATRP